MSELQIEYLPTRVLRPYPRNARTHSKKQIKQIADSIRQFGFTNPLLIDKDNTILAGHGRLAAAEALAMETVACVRLEHMTTAQKKAYVLADNKLALNAGWDEEILAIELQELLTVNTAEPFTVLAVFRSTPLCEGRPSLRYQEGEAASFRSTPLCEGRPLT